ncbi:MAG: phospholipase D family protein [Acidimicrobiaceae bacterium]|nr:phospholipase D family protein [Acidimicrobiaceae bacterium]
MRPSDEVGQLIAAARSEVLLVAPFVRSDALRTLLRRRHPDVATTIITRWRVADLVAGASDLDVLDVARDFDARVFLRHDLHAKIYVGDERCLVGSANLTATALGLRSPANLELLIDANRSSPVVVAFLESVMEGCVEATEELRDDMLRLLARLEELDLSPAYDVDGRFSMDYVVPINWLPRSMNPAELFAVYRGEVQDVPSAALPTMRAELLELGVVPGMNELEFRAWIASTIRQIPTISETLTLLDRVGGVDEATVLSIVDRTGADLDDMSASDFLRVLERWLSYFLDIGYETVRDSIRLIKASRL